jgi:hypothetical protein
MFHINMKALQQHFGAERPKVGTMVLELLPLNRFGLRTAHGLRHQSLTRHDGGADLERYDV